VKRFAVTIISILSFTLSTAAAAELETLGGRGTLYGSVVSRSNGEPLASANILLRGTTIGASADLDGRYRIEGIPPGVYAVQVSVLGYTQVVRSDVAISTARPIELTFQLEPTAIQLEEVTVRAGFFTRNTDAKVSTTVQSSEEIRRLPGGFEDVARAVAILPGVAQPSPGRNDLIVRGGAPSENLYLVDNIEVPNINHFGTQGATGGPQSFINLDYIDRTSFSTGGFGARYGDRLSSVLSIDLREGRKDKAGGKGTLSASQFGINLEGPLPNRDGAYLFSARRSYLDFIFMAAGFAFVPEYWDFLLKANTSLSPRDEVSVVGIAALDYVRLFNDSADQRYSNTRIPASDQQTYILGSSWKHLFGWGYSTLTLGQTVTDFNTTQRDSLLNPVFQNRSREAETSVRGEVLLMATPTTEVLLGMQQKFIGFHANILLPPFETSYGEVLSLNEALDTTGVKTALFAQVSQTISRLKVTLGGRVDHFSLIEDSYAFGPRFAATYRLGVGTNLNGSIGRYHQAPSYIWLTANPQNRDLSHITADQIVLGVDHLLRYDVRVNLEGYFKEYSNYPASVARPYLVLANAGAGFGGAEGNFTEYGFEPLVSDGFGWSRGIELFLQKKAAENPHYAVASVSYNESKYTGLDGIERPSNFDQRWIFNLGGGFLLTNRLEVSGKFRLATGRPYTPFETDGSQLASKYNTRRTRANHSLDLRADRRWFFDTWTLIGYVDVQNVYDNPYRDAPRWDERTASTLASQSIGILPSIGVSVEF